MAVVLVFPSPKACICHKSAINLANDCNISIYPNPTSNEITIRLDNIQNAELNIFSIDGRLLDYRKNVGEEIKYDLSRYAKGEYIISICAGNKVVASQTIIKQ